MKYMSLLRWARSARAVLLGGCNANVGVSVGMPTGDNGYLSVGTGRWF